MSRILGFALLGLLLPSVAEASQVAFVEDISGAIPGVARYQTLEAGTVIKVPAGSSVTISYFETCRRESVSGGTVSIGQGQSAVSGGTVKSEAAKCSSGLGNPFVSNVAAAAPLAFRRGPGTGKTPPGVPEPSVTVFNTAPAFLLTTPGELVIERLDQSSTARVVKAQGNLLDLQKHNIVLFAGGIYKATLNGREVIFRISTDAQEGSGPLMSRLIRM